MNNKAKQLILTAAIAGLTTTSFGCMKKVQVADDAPGQCHGVNKCKGTGACQGKGHDCGGMNACKGKGWISATKKECEAQSGKFVAMGK